MNIKVNKNINQDNVQKKNLNESQQGFNLNPVQNQQVSQNLVDTTNEEIVLKNKSKQFKFDCGIVMGRIDMNIKTKFGLRWHYDNSSNLDEFISSVEKFISISGNVLTDNDKSNLTKQYFKYSKS